jgi:hypothetical protein
MSTPTPQMSRPSEPAETAETAAPDAETRELIELDPVTATQGGLLGAKYDTGIGWQYF